MKTPRSLAVLGGPDSGKTTYLGVIADGLESGRLTHVEQDGLPDDATGLVSLAGPIQDSEYPQRTKGQERHMFNAQLQIVGDHLPHEKFALHMADYSGEDVDRLFRDRTRGWDKEWQARANTDGLLIFLRPAVTHNITSLPRVSQLAESTQDRWRHFVSGSVPARKKAAGPRGPESIFGPGLEAEDQDLNAPAAPGDESVPMPTVLSVIELLQFLRSVRGLAPGQRPRHGTWRIGIMVSAWDAVDPRWRSDGPSAWLLERASLLEEYLWSNFCPEDVLRFGLSATGGDLKNAEYAKKYDPEKDGDVVFHVNQEQLRTQNLAFPILWALFGDNALRTLPPKP